MEAAKLTLTDTMTAAYAIKFCGDVLDAPTELAFLQEAVDFLTLYHTTRSAELVVINAAAAAAAVAQAAAQATADAGFATREAAIDAAEQAADDAWDAANP